MKEWKR